LFVCVDAVAYILPTITVFSRSVVCTHIIVVILMLYLYVEIVQGFNHIEFPYVKILYSL
jgi:hypothetical protein